jgi:hypothetical protein
MQYIHEMNISDFFNYYKGIETIRCFINIYRSIKISLMDY